MMRTRIVVALFVLAFLTQSSLWAAVVPPWAVKEAPVRFVVALSKSPTHPTAGYFLSLPDKGTLPGPFPEPVVLDEGGAPLLSAVLWHCKETECSLVFQAPQKGNSVTVYVKGAKALKTWSPEMGLTPSAILCEINQTAAREAAFKLARLGSVGPTVHFVNRGWTEGNWQGTALPLAMWEWRPGGNAMYLLSYVDVKDPGNIWVAPQSRSGVMEIAVDGKLVKQFKKNEKLGGTGGEVNLSAGLHRVELYGHSPEGKPIGPMMFTWRTPNTTIEMLGGPRAKDLRYPGTSMCESYIIENQNVVKSGTCRILSIETQTGLLAAFAAQPDSIFSFPGEDALIAYTFNAVTKTNPKETQYTWSVEEAPEAVPVGSQTSWLLKAGKYCRVTLTAEAGGKRATASTVIYPYINHNSSLDSQQTRIEFKQCCYDMLRAYPDNRDPFTLWTESVWNNFFRVIEITGNNALLEYIVTRRWDYIKRKLNPDRKALMEDVLLFSMAPRNPQEAMKLATKLSAEESTGVRAAVLKLKRAEILMYYLDDLEGARKIIAPLLLDAGEAGEWAKLRMGDLEFLARNINAATQRYGDVQNRAKASTTHSTMPKRLTTLPSGPQRITITRVAPELERLSGQQKEQGKDSKMKPIPAPANLPPWKLSAIRDVAASESVGALIDQGFYLEAFQALQSWERTFPMSKISGDYILSEAKLLMAVKDFKRARKILTAYCEQVDASNFLPEAMEMVKICMFHMNEPDQVIEAYKKEILKRTVFGGGQD